MKYSEFYKLLLSYGEVEFREFQKRLIPTKQEILGVRTPILRRLAKEYQKDFEELFKFPDDCYEVTFIKLTIASTLPYEKFIKNVDFCVGKMDNWATCDSFKAKCIKNNKDEFLNELNKLFSKKTEFYQRYVLVVLLSEYVEEKYLSKISEYLRLADKEVYYVHMAAAWLTAEVLIKFYDYGVQLLTERVLDLTTHNKAIQKATESFRLTNEQKEYLRSLKIKKKTER